MFGRGLAVPLTVSYHGFVRGLGVSRGALRAFERSVNYTLRRMNANFRHMMGVLSPLRVGFAGFAAAIPIAAVEKLNQAIQKAGTVMGGMSDEMRQKMRATAIDISKHTRFYAHEAAEGFFYLGSAGLNAQQSLSALPATAEFAQAGLMDLSLATDRLLDAQTAMSLRSEDAGKNLENLRRVSDALTMGNKLSTATIEQMAEGLANGLGGALRLVNKDVEEGAALLAVFAERGTKGLAGGTAANIVLRDMQTKAIKFADKFRAARVKVFDDKGQMRFIGDIVADLERLTGDKSPFGAKKAILDLGFMDKSSRHLLDLLGTSERIREFYERIKKEGPGTTQRMAMDVMTPFQRSWNEFKGAFAEFSESLQPVITMLASLMSGAARTLETMEAKKFGGGVANFIIELVKAVGSGIQTMVGIVMEAMTMFMELIHRIRLSAAADRWGFGYEGGRMVQGLGGKFRMPGKGEREASRAIGIARDRTNWWASLPKFSDWLQATMDAGGTTKPNMGGGTVGLMRLAFAAARRIEPQVHAYGPYANMAVGGLRDMWPEAYRRARAARQEAAAARMPGWAGLGGRLAAAAGILGGAGVSGAGRGLGALGGMVGGPRAPGASFKAPWANLGVAQQQASWWRRAAANRPGFSFMPGGPESLRPGTAQKLGTALIPPQWKSIWQIMSGGFSEALRRRQGSISAAAISAQDPLSREGYAQRVRSTRVGETSKVQNMILAENKKHSAWLRKIAEKVAIELAPANISE